MKPQAVVAAWLKDASITGLVGTRKALGQPPDGTTYPALVYQIVTASPKPWVDYNNKPQPAMFRVQITPIATTIGVVEQIGQAVRNLMHMKNGVVVGDFRIMSSKLDSVGPVDRDNEAGVWVQSFDYLIWYFE